MSQPTSTGPWPPSEPATYGVYPVFPVAPAPPQAARQQPVRRSRWSRFGSFVVAEVRTTSRDVAEELLLVLLELVINVVAAAAVIAPFALVGYAVAESTGAILAGLLGLGVFLVLRVLVAVGVVVGGLGWLVFSKTRRDRR